MHTTALNGIILTALIFTHLQAGGLKEERALELVGKARIEYAQNNFKAMHKAVRKALELHPSCSPAYLYKGIYLVRQGHLEPARGWLQMALLADPGDALAHTFLGQVLYRGGDLPGAEDQWRLALRFDPCIAEAQAGLALILYSKGRDNDAIRHYKEAIRCDKRYYDLEYLSDAGKGAGWPAAKVEAVRPLLERVPPPTIR